MIKKYPFYVKVTVIMFGLVLLVYILLGLRDILVPLAFALVLAVLLNPLVIFLERLRFPHVLAIAVAIIITMTFITALTYFLVMQIKGISGDWPLFKQKFGMLFTKFQHFARTDFGINTKKQNEYINEVETNLQPVLASAMGTVFGGMAMTFLLPVYTFLFLYYKKLILNFLFEIFSEAVEK